MCFVCCCWVHIGVFEWFCDYCFVLGFVCLLFWLWVLNYLGLVGVDLGAWLLLGLKLFGGIWWIVCVGFVGICGFGCGVPASDC